MNVKDKFYIGSTKNIHKRIIQHKSTCYNKKANRHHLNVYKYIREICDDWNKVSFQILDVYDDISNKFRREIEDYYIKYFNNNLNMAVACTQFKSMYEYVKYYREKNKEYINQKILCECGRLVSRHDLARHKRSKIHHKYLNILNK